MVLKGLKTLEARIRIHSLNAWCLVNYLKNSPHVDKVDFTELFIKIKII